MKKKIRKVIPIWHFENLFKEKDVYHYTSSREGGVSTGKHSSLNLSYNVGDDPQNVSKNRKRLAEELKITIDKLIFPEQVHGSNIRIINSHEEVEEEIPGTDGLITQVPNIYISVLTADCVPLLFYDPVNKVIGAAHAGWKGTVKHIARKMVEKFREEFKSNPENILAGIGPSIGPDSYEVGKDVIKEVKAKFGVDSGYVLHEKDDGKAMFDLWKANRIQMHQMGIPPENIEDSHMCTYTDHEFFFSARQSGNDCGRFGNGIMIKD
jgi:YfiH family protein